MCHPWIWERWMLTHASKVLALDHGGCHGPIVVGSPGPWELPRGLEGEARERGGRRGGQGNRMCCLRCSGWELGYSTQIGVEKRWV